MSEPESTANQTGLLAATLADLAFPARPTFLPFEHKGHRFDLVTDRETLLLAFTVRFQAYTACGYIDPEDFPLGMELDPYDAVSVHFLARTAVGGNPAGYVRLIIDTRGRLQTDDLFDISDYRQRWAGRLCEMSRLIAWPAHRRGVGRGLRSAALRWAQTRGIAQVVGASLETDRDYFDRCGFLPMVPYRHCHYTGSHLRKIRGRTLYGNVLNVAANADAIAGLLAEDGDRPRWQADHAPTEDGSALRP